MIEPNNHSFTDDQNEKIIESLKYEMSSLKFQLKKKDEWICLGSAGNGVTPFFLSGYHGHPYRPWVIHRGLRELQDFALRATDILGDVG